MRCCGRLDSCGLLWFRRHYFRGFVQLCTTNGCILARLFVDAFIGLLFQHALQISVMKFVQFLPRLRDNRLPTFEKLHLFTLLIPPTIGALHLLTTLCWQGRFHKLIHSTETNDNTPTHHNASDLPLPDCMRSENLRNGPSVSLRL